MNYLNETGLRYFWGKIKDYVAENAGSGGGGASGDYLPLTGGTMTGEIVSTSSKILSSEGVRYNLSIAQSVGMVMDGNRLGYMQVAPNIIVLKDATDNTLRINNSGIARITPDGSDSSVWNTNGGITTFKTINGQSILGSGNIQIAGEGETVSDGNNYPTSLSTVMTTNSATQAIITTTLNRSGLSAITDTVTLSGAVSGSKAGLMTATDKYNLDYLWSRFGQELEADNLAMDIYSSGNTLYSRLYNTDTSYAVIDSDSGVTLKTINGESIIGSGNITVSSGTGGITQTAADARYLKKAGDTCTGNLAISGQVAIGTTSFDQALRVNGAIVVGDNGFSGEPCSLFMTAGFRHNDLSPNFSMSQAGVFTCKGNITTQANLTVSGGASFGDPVSMGDALEVADSVTALSFYESSDASLKENITSITKKAVDAVDCLHFKQFNFKDDEDKVTKYGVIAQEVEAVGLENLVKENENGEKSVDYISLLILKIEALEKRIAELEAKNAN